MDVKNLYFQYIFPVILLVLNITQAELSSNQIQLFSNGVPRHTIVQLSFCRLGKESLFVTLRFLSTV